MVRERAASGKDAKDEGWERQGWEGKGMGKARMRRERVRNDNNGTRLCGNRAELEASL